MMLGGKAVNAPPRVVFVGSTYTTTTGGNFYIDISSLGVQAGDLGILFVADADRSDSFTVSGWSELIPSNTSNAREGSLWTKTMTGFETSVESVAYVGSEGVQTATFFRAAEIAYSGTAESSVASPTSAPNPPPAVLSISVGDASYVAGMCEGSSSSISDIEGTDLTIVNGGQICTGVAYGIFSTAVASYDCPAFTGTFTTGRNIAHQLILRAV